MSGGVLTMRRGLTAGVALAAAVWLPAAVLAAPSTGQRVFVTACVYPGVTGNCLMIKGADGTVYNVSGISPRPRLTGRMIRLRGVVTDKMSICGQGLVVEGIRWTRTRISCGH
jgi:hypothetical protein